MKGRRTLACLVVATGLFASAFLFSGFERSGTRAQAGVGSIAMESGKDYPDIINWSWHVSAFGYVGGVSVTLKKEASDHRSGETEGLTF
jgi:hypothetical protein